MSKAQQEIRKALDAVGYTHDRMTVEFVPGGESFLMEGFVAHGWQVDDLSVGPSYREAAEFIQSEYGLDDLFSGYRMKFSEPHPADLLNQKRP